MGGSRCIFEEVPRPVGGESPRNWEEVNSIYDEATGLTYVDNPALQDPSRGIILYDPNIHQQVFDYVTLERSHTPGISCWRIGTKTLKCGTHGP